MGERCMINFHVIREAILSSMSLKWKKNGRLPPRSETPSPNFP